MGLSNPRIFPEVSYNKQVGTSPLEIWYNACTMQAAAPVTATLPINEFHAMPFVSGRGGTIDRIAFEVTVVGGLGSVARCGIYDSKSDDNFYPNTLIVDSGEFNTALLGGVGVKSATVSVTLQPNKVYWAVYLCGTSAPTIRRPSNSASSLLLGHPTTLGAVLNHRLSPGFTYAALPATYPSGANGINGSLGMWMRYSA